jgi:hypothetical protein
MPNPKLNFKTGKIFPWHFQLVGAILPIVAILIIKDHAVISLVLVLAGLTILTGQSGIEINQRENTYNEYLSFIGIRKGQKLKYPGVEKIFINTSKVSQRFYTAHTNHSSTFSNVEYNGYLKLTDGKKIHLVGYRKKEQLMKRLRELSKFLNVKIEDNTV